jgi:hypothetical protein
LIELCKFISHATDEEFNKRIGEFIDLDEFARYMAALVFVVDMDGILGPGQNFYLHLDAKTQKVAFIPWDLDHSFGQFGMRGTQEQRENLSIEKPWQGTNRFLERMFRHEPFQKLYRERLAEFSKTIFQPERFEKQVDELAAILRPSIETEGADKLERVDAVAAGKPVEPGSFGRGPGGPPMGFMQPAKPIKPFVKIRSASIADQLAGKPGQTIGEFGFGPPPGGGGPGGPGGARGFGPGMFLAGAFMPALDADKNEEISKMEMAAAFQNWFAQWNESADETLSDEELRTGIDKNLAPAPPFGGPGTAPVSPRP